MKTAQEARAATLKQIERIAGEFVLNEVADAIQKKINEGKFSLKMPLKGTVTHMEDYSSAIIKFLEDKGYTAEVCDNSNDIHDDEIYINISWKE